jgi:EmrB/QacA subfamily drug resistance transporter
VKPSTAAAIAYVTAMFMTAVDIQIVNVALPTLGRDFHSGVATVQWTVVGYVLSVALLIPASGWIGDRLGTKRTFLIALGIFTLASALCGSAQSLGELIAARVLQGVGGGMLMPVGTTMLYRAYPPEDHARITRLVIAPILIGPACAPIIGGLLTEHASWRWVFFINVPIGAAVLAMCGAWLEDYRGPRPPAFDLGGFVLGGGGLSLLIYAISEGSNQGWASVSIILTAAGGIVALATFVRLELRHRAPVLDLRLFHDRSFATTNAASFVGTGVFLGVLYLTPLFLQEVQLRSPITSGVTTFPEAIGVGVGAMLIGRLYGRLGARKMATAGATLICVMLITFQFDGLTTDLWWIRGQMLLMGLGAGTMFVPLQIAMFSTISPADTGHASAIMNTGRQVATAAFTAVISTIIAGVAGPRLHAFHSAFIAAAIGAGLAALVAVALLRQPSVPETLA